MATGSGVDAITRADVEQTADDPAALTAGLFFCSLCQSVYRQPKLLPCLHSYCRPCLVNLVSHTPQGSIIRCPSCLHEAPLPPSGVVGFPDNVLLNRICQDYVRELQGSLQGTQGATLQTGRGPSQQQATERRAVSTGRTRTDHTGRSGERASRGRDEQEDEEDEEEESQGARDPYASERSAPAEDSDGSTIDAIRNKNRLQAKVMGLQGEALRVTYAIDHINGWPEEWQTRREDLKRAVRAKSSQMQFAVKRAERALLARIDEGGRTAEHHFLREAEAGKKSLRDSLRNVLHEVTVLKSVRELGTDAEVNAMCAHLLGRTVGMAEVALEMPGVSLEAGGSQGETEEEMMQEAISKSFGTLVFTEQRADVFKPEPVDFSSLPVEDFVSKSSLGGEEFQPVLEVDSVVSEKRVVSNISSEVDTGGVITTKTTSSADKITQEEKSSDAAAEQSTQRKSRKRSTADKRRHMTDLGLDSPDVKEYLTQFQTARESFRSRRREILQQGQLGRVSAASPARPMTGSDSSFGGGLDAVRARLRSSSRDGGAGSRGPSLDRTSQQAAPIPGIAGSSAAASLVNRRGSAPVQRSSSLTRAAMGAVSSGLGDAGGFTSTTTSSKFLSSSATARKPPPSPVREDLLASGGVIGRGSDSILNDSLQLQPSTTPPFLSPQVQRRRASGMTRDRRHSMDAPPPLENISPSAAADLLTQGEPRGAGGSGGGGGGVSSRPIRRAISNGADKQSKLEILRETWQRRKELLIQNEGFVTPGNRIDFHSTGSPKQLASPPVSPALLRRRTVSASDPHDFQAPQASSPLAQSDAPPAQRGPDLEERSSNTIVTRPAIQLPYISAEPSSTYHTSLYSSHDSLSTRVLDTVKITIPEGNERGTSPIRESMKSPSIESTHEDISSPPKIGTGASSERRGSSTLTTTTTLVQGQTITQTTDDKRKSLEVFSRVQQPESPEEETTTTETIIYKAAPIDQTDRSGSTRLAPSYDRTATDVTQRVEDTASLTTTDTVQSEETSSQFAGSNLTTEISQSSPDAAPEPQETSTVRTATAPGYFFKSRLTGLPVGGGTATAAKVNAETQPASTGNMPYFKSRLTGQPVGGAASSRGVSNESTTTAAPPVLRSRLTGLPLVGAASTAPISTNVANTTAQTSSEETNLRDSLVTTTTTTSGVYSGIEASNDGLASATISQPAASHNTSAKGDTVIESTTITDTFSTESTAPVTITREESSHTTTSRDATLTVDDASTSTLSSETEVFTVTTENVTSKGVEQPEASQSDTQAPSSGKRFSTTDAETNNSTPIDNVDASKINTANTTEDAETIVTTTEIVYPSTITDSDPLPSTADTEVEQQTTTTEIIYSSAPSTLNVPTSTTATADTEFETTTEEIIHPPATSTSDVPMTTHESEKTEASAPGGYFKSRLTGRIVGPATSNTTTTNETTTAAETTTRTKFVPFFKSRLTGQPVGSSTVSSFGNNTTSSTTTTSTSSSSYRRDSSNNTTTTDTTTTTATPSATTSSRYPSRYSTESRYNTSSESVDVASLIAAMYGGNEKKIISTSPSAGSGSEDKPTSPRPAAASNLTSKLTSTPSPTSTATPTSTSPDTTTSGVAGRQLPPLRSAPAFSYTRRYNVSSSASPTTTAARAETTATNIGGTSRPETTGRRDSTGQLSSSLSQRQGLASLGTTRHGTEMGGGTTTTSSTTLNEPGTTSFQSTAVQDQSDLKSTGLTSQTTSDVFSYPLSSSSPYNIPSSTTTTTVGHVTRSPVVHRRHTVEVSQSVISEALATQTEQRLSDLDYPRAHLPDVIPETSLGITAREGVVRRHQQQDIRPEVVTAAVKDTQPTGLGGRRKEGRLRGEYGGEEVQQMTSSGYITTKGGISEGSVDSESEMTTTTTTTSRVTIPPSERSSTTTASELLKKAYGLDVDDPEISGGISLTDAIRKSDPAYRHYTTRIIPQPLDLTGATGSEVRDATPSPGSAPSRSPARSPSGSLSPAMSPTSPQGMRGKLKEIARKKKERWRHLTIH